MRDVDSTLATGARSAMMAVILSIVVLWRGNLSEAKNIGARSWLFIALAEFASAASWLCYFRALHIGEASCVAPIDKLSVVASLVRAVLFLGERPTAGIVFDTLLIVASSRFIICG